MKPKNNVYIAWQTDEKREPSGKERILVAPNAKWAASHIKKNVSKRRLTNK